MIDTKKIEQLAKQITQSIPPGVRDMADNVEGRVKQTLQQQLSKLDVVSREEFEIQQQMLFRLRQRIEVLEKQAQEQHDSATSSDAKPGDAKPSNQPGSNRSPHMQAEAQAQKQAQGQVTPQSELPTNHDPQARQTGADRAATTQGQSSAPVRPAKPDQ